MYNTNCIQILGSNGGKLDHLGLTSIQVSHDIVIDAGNILTSLGSQAGQINHIFLTHSHLDHIIDIPFIIDTFFEQRVTPLQIYGRKETLQNLKKHLFNWEIWPDFSNLLLKNGFHAIDFIELDLNDSFEFENTIITPIENNHTTSSCGYIIEKNKSKILFTSDTYKSDNIWHIVNSDTSIKSIIIDVSFPSLFDELAQESKHLTPKLLDEELNKLERDDVTIFANHLKPLYGDQIKKELNQIDSLRYNIKPVVDGDIINLKTLQVQNFDDSPEHYINQLNEIGYALTEEKNFDSLMHKILSVAKKLTNADAGTFYLMSDDEQSLIFKSVQTDSLNIKLGDEQNPIPWPNLYLYNEDGSKNNVNISVNCALTASLINIPDVYENNEFVFAGPRAFDEATGYKTTSMLVVPMKNHENDVIGVFQLINKQNINGEVCQFTQEDEKLILSMSSQAAISVTNAKLVQGLKDLLNSFIQSIATAIGEKSKYTAGHINRVAELTLMLANAINEDETGPYKDISFTAEQLEELDIAAWMHDIGKITTPEYVVDKAKKLETIYDRIHTVQAKFEMLKKDLEIELLRSMMQTNNESEKNALQETYMQKIEQLNEDFKFIEQVNKGGEFLKDESVERIEAIAKYKITINGEKSNLLDENEVYNLSIRKGTLTQEERQIINNHAKISFDMLNSLPFPKKLKNVPSIAGGHHEKICGGGYPQGLKGDEITLESRILAVADIFEALTAHDRPYKDPNSLNQSMKILYFMAKDLELDPILVKFFADQNLHLKYAKDNLMQSQKDEVTVNFDDF